ncbi:unnamed protein product, partial [marine sediment metagenome]
ACSLIYFTKIQMKEKMPLLGIIIVGPSVRKELIADLGKYPDAKTLKANLDKKIIMETDIKLKGMPSLANLGAGEKETIEISMKTGGIPVTDDHIGINYAITHGLKPKTTEILLLDFLQEEIITFDDFTRIFENLARIKSLKPNVISFFQNEAEKMRNTKNKKINNSI